MHSGDHDFGGRVRHGRARARCPRVVAVWCRVPSNSCAACSTSGGIIITSASDDVAPFVVALWAPAPASLTHGTVGLGLGYRAGLEQPQRGATERPLPTTRRYSHMGPCSICNLRTSSFWTRTASTSSFFVCPRIPKLEAVYTTFWSHFCSFWKWSCWMDTWIGVSSWSSPSMVLNKHPCPLVHGFT